MTTPPYTIFASAQRGAGLTAMICLLAFSAFSLGQSLPVTTQPAAAVVIAPPGFVRFAAGRRTFIALPADQPWVAAAGARAAAAAASTRPANMIDRLAADHDKISTAMLADLQTLTPSQVDDFLNKDFLPLLKDLAAATPRLVYLVAPTEHLKQALRNGWTDPRVYYNKVADTFEVSRSITFDAPGKAAESIVIVTFRADETEERRAEKLSQYLTAAETEVEQSMNGRANALLIARLATFIADKAFAELPRGDDRIWFADGLSTVLAAKYMEMVHGAPELSFIRQVAFNPPDAPVNAASIDLLHPQPADQLRPEIALPYAAARHRKDVAVMYVWIVRAGEKQIASALAAVVRAKPADGTTLVKVLKDASGVDLSAEAGPQ